MPLQLPKLSFDTLLALVANAPNVVTHDELAMLVWGDARVVTSENIAQRVMMLRRCLSDSSVDPRYIKGVRGHGYKLIPDVTVTSQADGSNRAKPSDAHRVDEAGRRFVAILPFVRTTTDPREVDFARGLYAEVTQCLVRVANVRTHLQRGVRAYVSSPAIELIVKGSVRIAGSRVQAVAQLVDPITCSCAWSRAYDCNIAGALSLQTDITNDLVRALKLQTPARGALSFMRLKMDFLDERGPGACAFADAPARIADD